MLRAARSAPTQFIAELKRSAKIQTMNSTYLFFAFIHLLAVFCCVIDIVKTRKGSGGSALWLFVVICVPLGFIVYMLFGDTKKESQKKKVDLWVADAELKKRANSGDLE